MKDTAYAFSVAKIRAIENGLLSRADMELLISTKHIDDAVRILTDKGYGSGELQNKSLFNILFKQETEKVWQTVREIAPSPEIFNIFLYKNDYHNLKVILKGLAADISYEDMIMSPYNIDPAQIKEAVSEGNFGILPKDFAKAAESAYHQLTRENSIQGASITIDRASVEALCKAAGESKNEFFIGVTNLMADCINMKTALRCAIIGKDMNFIRSAVAEAGTLDINSLIVAAGTDLLALKEYILSAFEAEGLENAENDFSAFEKWCDDTVMQYIMKAKYKSFGPEPVLAYIFAKETEIKALHIILTGKLNKLEDEEIRRRLKMLYV